MRLIGSECSNLIQMESGDTYLKLPPRGVLPFALAQNQTQHNGSGGLGTLEMAQEDTWTYVGGVTSWTDVNLMCYILMNPYVIVN